MRKLGVLLDSEHYTDVYYKVFSGDDVKEMTDLMGDDDFELTDHSPKGRFVFEQSEDSWAVGQVFEINNKPLALVQHHAYDGVDFYLLGQFDTFNDALEARDKAIHKMIDDWVDPFNKVPEQDEVDIWNNNCTAVWDDGEEWHVWSIIDVSID